MQTFLPYVSFDTTAGVLDIRRLGKQRVETLQVMTAILEGTGWVNHPAVKMWRGYETALLRYQMAICKEWTDVHGYADTCLDKTWDLFYKHKVDEGYEPPWWLGDRRIHLGYQSNLLGKNPDHYSQYFPNAPLGLGYHWPVS